MPDQYLRTAKRTEAFMTVMNAHRKYSHDIRGDVVLAAGRVLALDAALTSTSREATADWLRAAVTLSNVSA
jgi:hypothetical protein